MSNVSTPALLVLSNSIVAIIDNKRYEANSSHPQWDAIREAVKNKEFAKLPGLFEVKQAIQQFIGGDGVTIHNGSVYWNGAPIHNTLTVRILDAIKNGLPHEPLIRFFNKVMVSTSFSVRNELFLFLESAKLPIAEDGDFLAYKKVNRDYTSIYDGKTPNNIGTTVEMDRGAVDDDRDNTCSYGLHFCSFDYLSHFGSRSVDSARVLIVKINPANVVSIPSDYDNTKGRACKYDIIGELSDGVQQNVDVLADAPSIVTKSTVVENVDFVDYSISSSDEDDANWADEKVLLFVYNSGYSVGRNHGTKLSSWGLRDLYKTEAKKAGISDAFITQRLTKWKIVQAAYDLGTKEGRAGLASVRSANLVTYLKQVK